MDSIFLEFCPSSWEF